jgi:hypothetical protein
VQGHYDFTFIAVNYKDDDLQYKDVTSNSNVTNWMRRRPFLNTNRLSDGKETPLI